VKIEKEYKNFERRAAARGLKCHISLWYYNVLKNGSCHYCGVERHLVTLFCHKLKIKTPFMTIDRKDNDQGYLPDNCVSCCFVCNRTKSNFFSYEEMLEIGKIVASKWSEHRDETWASYVQNVEEGAYDL
jgi:hypothetical protein